MNVNAVAFGFVEMRLTAASDSGGESFVRDDGIEIPMGIPERMRQMDRRSFRSAPGDAGGRGRSDLLPLLAMVDFVHGQVITASGGQTTGMTW